MSKGSGGPKDSWGDQFCAKEGSRVHYRGAKPSTVSRNASGVARKHLEELGEE